MQHDNMKLHAILSKFHIEHTQNGATVQHTHSIQVIATICPKQQLGILQASKQHATGPQQEKRHGCTGKALQNMNTELSPEITRTCSKGHGKIAK